MQHSILLLGWKIARIHLNKNYKHVCKHAQATIYTVSYMHGSQI